MFVSSRSLFNGPRSFTLRCFLLTAFIHPPSSLTSRSNFARWIKSDFQSNHHHLVKEARKSDDSKRLALSLSPSFFSHVSSHLSPSFFLSLHSFNHRLFPGTHHTKMEWMQRKWRRSGNKMRRGKELRMEENWREHNFSWVWKSHHLMPHSIRSCFEMMMTAGLQNRNSSKCLHLLSSIIELFPSGQLFPSSPILILTSIQIPSSSNSWSSALPRKLPVMTSSSTSGSGGFYPSLKNTAGENERKERRGWLWYFGNGGNKMKSAENDETMLRVSWMVITV